LAADGISSGVEHTCVGVGVLVGEVLVGSTARVLDVSRVPVLDTPVDEPMGNATGAEIDTAATELTWITFLAMRAPIIDPAVARTARASPMKSPGRISSYIRRGFLQSLLVLLDFTGPVSTKSPRSFSVLP
jgi:hypothetical protein